jgi:hypothetical protein
MLTDDYVMLLEFLQFDLSSNTNGTVINLLVSHLFSYVSFSHIHSFTLCSDTIMVIELCTPG